MQLMWKNTVGDFSAETWYSEENNKFLVSVTHLETKEKQDEEFDALEAPLFGMDYIDQNTSLSIAEELARKLESLKTK